MKAYIKSTTRIISFVLSFLFAVSLCAQVDMDYTTISGVVKDKRSKKKLESVSISVPGTNIGTVTNEDGEFVIKIKEDAAPKSIEISHIGYVNYILPITEKSMEDITIWLTANENELAEVVVHPNNPRALVEAAIEKIESNYSAEPNRLTGFYRETVKKGRNYINISEAVIDVYKTPYKEDVKWDKVQVFKGRKLISPKASDTLAVKLLGGPNLSIYLDVVKNSEDVLLDMETVGYYRYEMQAPVMIEERTHYVISFRPIIILPYALYSGKFYIDKESLTFSRVEFSLDMDNRHKATQAILVKKPAKLHFKPEEVSFLVTYKQRDGRSYLNYIRNNIRFKCDWKKRFFFFSTGYEIVSEMVVTDRKSEGVENIPNKLAFKQNHSLSDKVSDFSDANFWEDFNIIEPTESLESAVNKLKKKYKL
ncbi:carboxypeptidase-like regulatory domain-containing protein [Prevotella sp. 10(H)]|uniref:carboxypeptidase-like regulatory domain-containing protein n=1 Tax=Prevotella sp. 10(H) TaxID=1158294 RepID=UPI0004A6DB4F|nr:carboxypeptidase-like regulatory domain-containing protein [Prevotella sp. 10(H)]